MQSLLQPPPPKSKFVTVVAWLGILSGASVTFSAVAGMAFERPSPGLVAALVGGVSAMVAGVGLNQREEWARQGFMFVLVYGMVGALVDFAVGPLRIGRLLGLLVALALNLWIIAKLRSPAVRAEFEESE